MLAIHSLSKSFGGIQALQDLSFRIKAGEVHGLIGPNGSGKSTTVNLISGLYTPTSGTIEFLGHEITQRPLHARPLMGISRTFQNIRLFGELSVWQNLWIAQRQDVGGNVLSFLRKWTGLPGKVRDEIDDILEFSALHHRRNDLASNLSFGEQRRLELARAIACKPQLILMDEPAAGMNLEEIKDLQTRITQLRDQGMTILLIEHHMNLVMSVTDTITVLNFGRKIAEGTADHIQSDPAVQEAYLGVSA